MKSIGLKIISLFLAIVVWFVFSAPRRERPSERTFAAPLSLVGMRREYVITTPVPETVSVRLRGRLSDLRSLSSQTLEVPVDLAWVERSGTAMITLHPQALNVPADVEVLSIEPNKFQFMVEGLRQAEVPIRPLIDGEVPKGYLAGEATADPAVALVSGPASQIRTFSEVRTERIIMTGRTATFTQSVDVVSESQLVRVISPMKTMVTVPILPPVGPTQPPPETPTTTTTTTTGDPDTSTSTQ